MEGGGGRGRADRTPSAGGCGAVGGGGRTPSSRIATRHFAAAVVFLVAGAAVLVWRTPALAAGAFPDRGLVAGAHLLTLGWISTSLMGVLHRLLPAALDAPVRWRGLAHAALVLWTAGVAAFVLGVGAGRPVVHLAGAGALGAAVLLFAANLAATLRRARRRGLTWWCVAAAVTSLAGAWTLGALLAVNLVEGVLGGSRFTVLAVHLHVAAGGWMLLPMIPVADRLLPAFLAGRGTAGLPGLGTGDRPARAAADLPGRGTGDRPARAAAGLVGAGTAGLLLSGHLLPVEVLGPALALQAAGAAAFLVQALRHYRRRGRRRLDPGTRLVAGALVSLGAAVAVGTAALLAPAPGGRLLTAYGVLLVPGGLGLLVTGHLHGLLPLPGETRDGGPVPAARDAPRATDPGGRHTADASGALLWGGSCLLALGVAVGEAGLCRAGALGFAAGAVIHAARTLRGLWRR